MPTTEIPEIIIPEIPTVNHYIYTPLPVLNVPLPNIDLPGCVKTHRDASVTNTQIIEDDVNGAFYSCPEGKIPSCFSFPHSRIRAICQSNRLFSSTCFCILICVSAALLH